MMPSILAADLSLNSSGIVILDIDKGTPIHYENISSGLDGIERLNYNYTRYLNILKSYRNIQCIVFEEQKSQMRFSYSAGNILPLAENVGVFKLAVYHSLSEFITMPIILGVPAQDIKKYATGNGSATKEEMIAAVNGNHLRSIRRDIPEHSVNDVADAYHLSKMARDLLLNKEDYEKYIVRDYREYIFN